MNRDKMLELLRSDRLAINLPEVESLKQVPQPPQYHAEGDAFTHTRLAVAALPEDADERLVWAVALHDIGKAETTRMIDGRWRAFGHDQLSASMAQKILIRFEREDLADDVAWLIRHHHFAISWQPQNPFYLTKHQQRFCRHHLFGLLVQLCRADAAGSVGQSKKLEMLELILSSFYAAEDS